MFVFGEVQDPTPETVNLVEDIVRSQIIELVCRAARKDLSPQLSIRHHLVGRLFKPEILRAVVELGICPLKI
jgi:Transcription initiation factor IID, 18kD subunit